MEKALRIGTRDSQLAVWQASLVQEQLRAHGIASELVMIKSEGDIDLVTPLYELGVQGIFTQTLDAALLGGRIDIAVHSMKDVPTQLARGIAQAAVLERASYKDLFVYKHEEQIRSWRLDDKNLSSPPGVPGLIATSSIRRKAQWLHRYPEHRIENLRGNVNTRLRKVAESEWDGAIFAAAGLERISLRPERSVELDWMLPAPAQGAIMVVCKEDDGYAKESCALLNHEPTALCTKLERDFLRALLGGCATPISALAEWSGDRVTFTGNIVSVNGSEKIEVSFDRPANDCTGLGKEAAQQLLQQGGDRIINHIRNGGND